jgi:hypothetical protein
VTSATRDVPTPVGPARILLEGTGAGVLLLGHGAGGATGHQALDLLAARDAGLSAGLTVVQVEQPWRVAGRRVAEAPGRLDAAWLAVVAAVAADRGGPLVVGGRSSGARVACRTAQASGAAGVLALAFPLRPPGGPGRTRLPELLLPAVPRLVVQGDRDAFGRPEAQPGIEVHAVRGADHGFAVRRQDGRTPEQVRTEVRDAVQAWLERLVAGETQTLT